MTTQAQPALYSFHDAITALTEGRCRGIKAEHGFASYLVLNKDNVLCWQEPETPFLQVHYYLEKWTLVGEKLSPQPWSSMAHVHPTARWLFLKDHNHLQVG